MASSEPTFHAVLFDLDGTLLDTVPDLACAVNRMLAALGLAAVSEEALARFVGRGTTRLVERSLVHALGCAPSPEQLAAAVATFERCYAEESGRRSRPYPGVETALRELSQAGLPMAVVTNKAARFTGELIRAVGWQDYFRVLVCGDTLPVKKPDPGMVLHALRELGVAPQQALLIGDSRHDAEAGRAAGCTVWCVPYGYNEGEPVDADACDAIVSGLEEAARRILGADA